MEYDVDGLYQRARPNGYVPNKLLLFSSDHLPVVGFARCGVDRFGSREHGDYDPC